MQLTELETFLAIVETGSLVRASEELNVTQSTVTARLKSLEAELGQPLIVRNKSGASLTGAGEKLRRYAGTISDLWRQARQETALPDATSTVCNIGCHPDLWPSLGERHFDFLRTKIPQAAISVWHGNQDDLRRWLTDGLTDLSMTYWPNANQKQDVLALYKDRLVLVSTMREDPMPLGPRYVYVEAGDDFGREHATTYADMDTARISFGSADLAFQHLLKHGGSAYLPRRMMEKQLQNEVLFPVPGAAEFERKAFLIVNRPARETWPWFEDYLNTMMLPPS